MSRSTINLRPLLGLALAALTLSACNAPDAGPTAEAPTAVLAGESASPMPRAAVARIEDEVDSEAGVAAEPMNPMAKQLIQIGAGFYALGEACSPPGAVDLDDARAANRKGLTGRGLAMSEAEMDAAFDAAYSDAEQKLEALSAAELSSTCAELEAMGEAAKAMAQ